MAPRAPGEADDAAPVPRVPPTGRPGLPPGPIAVAPSAARASEYGVLALRVQPADARIIIDGEEWRSSQPEDRITLQLGEGRHQVQLEKAGFQTFSGTVDVKAGETSTLSISLLAR